MILTASCKFLDGPAPQVPHVTSFPADRARPEGELAPVMAQLPALYARQIAAVARAAAVASMREACDDRPCDKLMDDLSQHPEGYELVKSASADTAWQIHHDRFGSINARYIVVYFGIRSKAAPQVCRTLATPIGQMYEGGGAWGDLDLISGVGAEWDRSVEGDVPCSALAN